MFSKNQANDSWLKIGRVGRAHGLRGDFFVSGRDEPIPKSYGKLLIGDVPESARPTTIEKLGWLNERPVLKCSLASDRTAAEQLSGQPIWVAASAVQVDNAKEYLWSDLEGRQVNDARGVCLGRVRSVYNAGAGDVIEIEDQVGRLLDVPMIAQYFDMSFTRGESELTLVVTADFFNELWQDVRPPKVKSTKAAEKSRRVP